MGSQGSDRITNHYSHGEGSLQQQDEAKPFHCDGCQNPGYGLRYRCDAEGCNVELHSSCAKFSENISFFMHPHELAFMTRPADGWKVICSVCSKPITGCFYGCYCLKFDAHPVCAELPETVEDSAHPGHSLTYVFPRDPTPCCSCGEACDGWRYRCIGGCKGVDFHRGCLKGDGVGGTRAWALLIGCKPEWIVFALLTSFQAAIGLWDFFTWIFEMFH